MEKLFENYKLHKKLLVEALVEKDYLEIYKFPLLKNDFIIKLGEPRYELHKLELDIAKTKLKLEMMQVCIQFQIPIDAEHIERTLQKEFEKHFNILRMMKREIDNVRSLGEENESIHKNARELKELYLTIASFVHPELICGDGRNIRERIWKATREAYEKRDTAKLKRLYKKTLGEFKGMCEIQGNQKELTKAVRSMKTKTRDVQTEIEKLKKQFPFNEAKLLEDDDAIEKFRKDIDLDIKIARELLDKLEKQILEKLPPPGDLLN